MSNMQGNYYWPELDGLRAVAFILVFSSHCSPPIIPGNYIINSVAQAASWGWLGVDLFFVLSGFLISHLLLTEKDRFGDISIWKFYARRALRIWPVYVTVLTAASIFPLCIHHWNSAYRAFLFSVVGPFYYFAGNYALIWNFPALATFCQQWGVSDTLYVALLVPLWSLCVEEQFYIVWPLILQFLKSGWHIRSTIFAIFLFSIAWRTGFTILAQKNGWSHATYYMDTLANLDGLMVGAAIAFQERIAPGWYKKHLTGLKGFAVFSALCLMFLFIVFKIPTIYQRSISIVPTMTIVNISFGLLLLLAMSWRPLKSLLTNPLIRSVGTVSFAMYVIHYFCIRVVSQFLIWFPEDPLLRWLVQFSLSIILTFLAAQLSWHLVESKILKLRNGLSRIDHTNILVTRGTEQAITRDVPPVLADGRKV